VQSHRLLFDPLVLLRDSGRLYSSVLIVLGSGNATMKNEPDDLAATWSFRGGHPLAEVRSTPP
jgi:hypothetical protein